jgi:hypothetical protein
MSNQNKKVKRVRKLATQLARTAYVDRAIGQKQLISNRVFKKTGRNIVGRGDYTMPVQGSASGQGNNILARAQNMVRKLATPFMDNTASVGLVNRGARYIGNKLGQASGIRGAGQALGNAASYAARFLGFGDYAVQRNCLANEAIATFKGAEDTVISGREFIANINGAGVFTNQSFILNPGNSAVFPWLSTVARNYEEWSPLGIVFEFRTTSAFATGTTNSALGTVIMATDYDVVDTPYTNKQAMLISTFSNSQAPCTSFYHPIECASQKNPLNTYYVQTGTSAADYPDDPRFSALGNFQIAAEGMQVSNVVGELWVSYRFKFSKPQLELAAPRTYAHLKFSATVNGNATTVFSDGISPSIFVSGVCTNGEYADVSQLPAGDYLMVYDNRGDNTMTGTGTSANPVTLTGGAEILQHTASATGVYGAQDSFNAALNTNVATIELEWSSTGFIIFRMTGPASSIGVPLYTWDVAGNPVACYRDFYISRIPVYSETAFTKRNFLEQFMANKESILQLMNGKDEALPLAPPKLVRSKCGEPESIKMYSKSALAAARLVLETVDEEEDSITPADEYYQKVSGASSSSSNSKKK